MTTLFQKRVYEFVKRIPKGKVVTYAKVAKSIGYPGAYRAVGSVLNKNYDPKIPCHRVVRSDGKLGKYNRGADQKRRLLEKEQANAICLPTK